MAFHRQGRRQKYESGHVPVEGYLNPEGHRARIEGNPTEEGSQPDKWKGGKFRRKHCERHNFYDMPDISQISKKKNFNKEKYHMKFNPYDAKQWFKQKNFEKRGDAEVEPVYNITPEEFQKLRTHSTVEEGLNQLDEIGIDLEDLSAADFTKPITRVLFACINTYIKPVYLLGVGPLNDGITCASFHRYYNYFVYYLHNPRPEEFIKWLKIFLDITTENLTVYYAGHGSQIKDKSGDEESGYDQVMVFDTGYIIDDDLAVILQTHTKGKAKVTLINDCCHSGTILDIPKDILKAEKEFPANIMQISSAADSQTAKQMSGLGNVKSIQGLFTYYFFTKIRENPLLTPTQAVKELSPLLKKYTQDIIVIPTSRNLTNEPIFPKQITKS
jgi:hypothetical protein